MNENFIKIILITLFFTSMLYSAPFSLNQTRYLTMKEFGYIEFNKIEIPIKKTIIKKIYKKTTKKIVPKIIIKDNELSFFLEKIKKLNNSLVYEGKHKSSSKEIESLTNLFQRLKNKLDGEFFNKLSLIMDDIKNISNYSIYQTKYMEHNIVIDEISKTLKKPVSKMTKKKVVRKIVQKPKIKKIQKQNNINLCQSINVLKIDKTCFKDIIYFNNYIYYSIKSKKLPKEKLILKFGDYKVFNDVAKYYIENKKFKKSKKYLLKAFKLTSKKDKMQIDYNLGTLYGKVYSKKYNKKSMNYFLKTTYKESYFNIGIYYYMGRGIKENDKLAYKYMKKASKLGVKRAKDNLKIMKRYKIGL